MENVATYSEARSEYTKQLATFVVPSLVGWFQSLWHRNSFEKQRCLSLFQSECEEIARWNQDRIHDEVRVLIERSGCDYMEELMTAVFIAHTKVLTAVRLSSKQKKLSITVPKLDHFIHRIFRETARSYWKSPFLFTDSGAVVDRQKNVLQIEALATEAITTAVRSLLPVKQILKDYLDGDEDEEIDDDEAAAEVVATVEEEVPEEKKPVEEKKEEPAAAVTVTKEEVEIPKIEVKEVEPAAAATPEKPSTPAIIKIDTEPAAVHFSDYDAVFDEEKGTEMRYTPKEEDDDEYFNDGLLKIDESSAAAVGDDDVEDLDAPAKVVPNPIFKEEIGEDEVEMLE
jgi:hypothetical protein